jgi:hypothetical protein
VAAVSGLNGHPAAAAAPPISLVVARHSGAGWDAHAPGLQSLARELGYAGRRLEVSEASLADVDKADVVYLTGHARLALGDAETQALGRVPERGGLVAGDGCAAGPRGDAGAREFAHSFAELADSLGLHLEAAGRAHPLFAAGRYLFAIAPPGARTSTVLLADSGGAGLVYCDADYGCAWAGGAPTQPLPRAAIRDALELGINLATLATHKSSPATH